MPSELLVQNENNDDVKESNMMDTKSALSHLKESLNVLNTIMINVKIEREELINQGLNTTHLALFECPIPETTLMSLVALSHLAVTAAEMNLQHLLFVDGLHMQFGSIMSSIRSVLIDCDPIQPKLLDDKEHHHHHCPPEEDIFHKHGIRSLRSVSHHDPTLQHHHDLPILTKHLVTDYHINFTGEVDDNISNHSTRAPISSAVIHHISQSNNRLYCDNSLEMKSKRFTDILKSTLMLLDYSFYILHDLITTQEYQHHHTARNSICNDLNSIQHRPTYIEKVPRSASVDTSSLQLQVPFDTTLSDHAIENYRSLIALFMGNYEEATNHVSHILKKRFGHTVPPKLGGKKKIVISTNSKNKLEEATAASNIFTSKEGHGGEIYHDYFENTTIRSELFPLGTLIENKQKTPDEIIMAQIASNGNIGRPIITNSLGSDEYTYWLQWSLLITDVPGYGFMGYSNHQLDNNLDSLTPDVVREVYNNLKNIYSELCNNTTAYLSTINLIISNNMSSLHHDTADMKKDPNNTTFTNTSSNSYIGFKLIYVAALCKLAVYNDINNELNLYIKEFHKLAEILNDSKFLALAWRYQLDYDEYEYSRKLNAQQFLTNPKNNNVLSNNINNDVNKIDNNNNNIFKPIYRQISELQVVLKNVKKYRYYSQYTNDMHMKRDSLKKLMNIYLEINQTYIAHNKKKNTDNLQINVPNTSLELELRNMTIDAIDRKEQTDAGWLGKIAHLRAKAVYQQYKELSIVLSSPINQSTIFLEKLINSIYEERYSSSPTNSPSGTNKNEY